MIAVVCWVGLIAGSWWLTARCLQVAAVSRRRLVVIGDLADLGVVG